MILVVEPGARDSELSLPFHIDLVGAVNHNLGNLAVFEELFERAEPQDVVDNFLDKAVSLDTTPTPTMPQSLEIMRRAAKLIPSLERVAPEAARITARPIPKDGLSAVGPMPRVENYYLVVTHSGATLSPYLAQAAADEIVRGKRHAELEEFRPGRFFN